MNFVLNCAFHNFKQYVLRRRTWWPIVQIPSNVNLRT